ncbi:MAG: ImpA family metalloprotease [Roseiflexaceae bacterium]
MRVARLITLLVVLVIGMSLIPLQSTHALVTAPRANTPPVLHGSNGRYVVAEGSTVGTVVGSIYATDADNDALVYTLLDGSGFAVDVSTGNISVITPPTRTNGAMRTLSVQVSDGTARVVADFQVFVTPAAAFATTGVTRDTFLNVAGGSINELRSATKFKNNTPDATTVVNQLYLASQNVAENFGQRYRGYIIPSVSGEYRFWVSSDDASELRIGSSNDPASLSVRAQATQTGWNSANVWDKSLAQRSDVVVLVKGQAYYVEALFKEWGGAEHFAVAWQSPGMTAPVNGSTANVIPQANLRPVTALADSVPPPTPQYASVETVSGSGVTLIWQAATDASGIHHYTIARNGVPVALLMPPAGTFVRYTDAITSGTHNYTITATDNAALTSGVARVDNVNAGVAYSAYTAALVNGDARLITDPQPIYGKIRTAITDETARVANYYNAIYTGITSINYTPSSAGQLMEPLPAAAYRVFPLLRASACGSGACSEPTTMASFGFSANGTRFVALPWDSFGSTYAGYTTALKQTISWVLTGNGATPPSSVGDVAILNVNSSNINTNLQAMGFSTSAGTTICSVATVATCFAGKKLIIVGSDQGADADASTVVNALATAVTAGIPVLYVEDHWYYTNKTQAGIGALLGFRTTRMQYFNQTKAVYANAAAVTAMKNALQGNIYGDFLTVINHLDANDWSVNLSGCTITTCSNATTNTYLNTNFYNGARAFMKARLNGFDERGMALFATSVDQNVPLKYAVLLGDIFRRTIRYPLSAKDTTASTYGAFFKMYFADHAVLNLRPVNPAQPDMGSFSKPIRADVPRYTTTVSVDTRTGDYFTALGYYALPGQTFTLTRTDSNSVAAKVAVNSLREGSTHEMENYSRPKYLMTPWMPLVKDQTVTITSPYGGPIQVWIEGSETAQTVTLTIANVGQHPVWNGAETTQQFYDLLNAGDYDWAEFLTPGFQIHSRRDLMLETLTNADWNTPEKLATAIMEGFYVAIYNLAGFTGPALSLNASVTAQCTDLGWVCTGRNPHGITSMNHFNADQATCGYGCSGNPYDAWWAFDVLGWGDSHEMGHNIQALHINNSDGGLETGEVSNNVFPSFVVYKWNQRYPSRYRMASHELEQDLFYKGLNDAQTRVNPIMAVNNMVWRGDTPINSVLGSTAVNWGTYRLSFYLQLVQQARVNPRLTMGKGGWDLITMLYMHDRLLNAYQWDDTTWNAQKTSLGMADYSRIEANNIDNNSLFLIRASWILKTDQRPFFDMWGIRYSDKASAQVASYGFTAAEKRYSYWAYDTAGLPQWSDDAIGSLPVDGAVRTVPHVPMNYVITPNDTRTVAPASVVTLTAYVGAAGTVEFQADGVTIPGCGSVATAARTTLQPIDASIHDLVATCAWTTPAGTGDVTLTTILTNSAVDGLGATSRPVVVNVAVPASATATTVPNTPTDTLTPSTTLTPSLSATRTPTYAGTATRSLTRSRTATATRTNTNTRTNTATRTNTRTRTATRTATNTFTPSNTLTSTRTRTNTATRSSTRTRTSTRSMTPTRTATP